MSYLGCVVGPPEGQEWNNQQQLRPFRHDWQLPKDAQVTANPLQTPKQATVQDNKVLSVVFGKLLLLLLFKWTLKKNMLLRAWGTEACVRWWRWQPQQEGNWNGQKEPSVLAKGTSRQTPRVTPGFCSLHMTKCEQKETNSETNYESKTSSHFQSVQATNDSHT